MRDNIPVFPATIHVSKPSQQKPDGADVGGTQDAAIDEKFINFSTTTFYRDYWGYDYQEGFSGPSVKPGPIMDNGANDTQEFAQDQLLSFLDQGPIAVFCTWKDYNSGMRFGVKLQAHFQMFGIGYRPEWYYSVDYNAESGSEPQWIKSGDDPSDPYTWDQACGFAITGTPDSSHTSLTVSITINDLG